MMYGIGCFGVDIDLRLCAFQNCGGLIIVG